jgi:hypothetical protein
MELVGRTGDTGMMLNWSSSMRSWRIYRLRFKHMFRGSARLFCCQSSKESAKCLYISYYLGFMTHFSARFFGTENEGGVLNFVALLKSLKQNFPLRTSGVAKKNSEFYCLAKIVDSYETINIFKTYLLLSNKPSIFFFWQARFKSGAASRGRLKNKECGTLSCSACASQYTVQSAFDFVL